MSHFLVNLNEPNEPAAEEEEQLTIVSEKQNAPQPGDYQEPKKRSGFRRFLKWFAAIAGIILVAGSIGGFFYWQSVKKTPAYSLGLLVDAARRDDKAELEKLVDTEAVIDNFMPQITAKAVELYGRGLPPQTIAKVEQAATPLMPAIKERAKAELPRVIREKTAPVEKIPYWLIALGANRAVDIAIDGDTATIKSKLPERQLELTMQRDGERWKVVGMKDDVLARKIAEKIGQDMIAFATKGGIKKAGEQMGVQNLDEILKKAQDIFK